MMNPRKKLNLCIIVCYLLSKVNIKVACGKVIKKKQWFSPRGNYVIHTHRNLEQNALGNQSQLLIENKNTPIENNKYMNIANFHLKFYQINPNSFMDSSFKCKLEFSSHTISTSNKV